MKIYNENKSVLQATKERLDFVFNEFDKICVSFSGGKDSGVLLNLALEASKRNGNKKIHVLFIDLEGQYKHTIDYVKRAMEHPNIEPYWVCLPLHLRNAVSQIQPHWLCWDPEKKESWIRELPKKCISDESFFPFFRKGMEFEEFVPDFAKWLSQGDRLACLIGIRSDESLNRYRTIASTKKVPYKNKPWSTKLFPKKEINIFNFYPIYDWRTKDIWRANGKFKYDYNHIYDLMYKAGVSLHNMRLCQPYGDDQRKGLFLFKIIEPETWSKVVARVEGANFGSRYSESQQITLGHQKFILPDGHSFESYAKMLLKTMPPHTQEHYNKKITTFMKWWKEKGGVKKIPDLADKKQEASKKAPSWRRICKTLIKNDYWCKGLSFAQTKKEMERQLEIIKKYTHTL